MSNFYIVDLQYNTKFVKRYVAVASEALATGQLRRGEQMCFKSSKVKFSHTQYRALGPELIPVYRQSARR